METKKSTNANIENKRFSLLLMGLSVAGAITLMSFEYRNFQIEQQFNLQSKIAETSRDLDFKEFIVEQPIEQTVQKPLPPVAVQPIITPDPRIIIGDPGDPDPGPGFPIIGGLVPIGTGGDIGGDNGTTIDTEVIDFPQDPAEYPGGMAALYEYLGKSIKYPELARENGIEGKVYIQFIIEKDGSITDVGVLKGRHKSLDAEATRVVNAMPKWKPGKMGNKNVRVRFTLPINFVLEN
jgi:protein TonB